MSCSNRDCFICYPQINWLTGKYPLVPGEIVQELMKDQYALGDERPLIASQAQTAPEVWHPLLS